MMQKILSNFFKITTLILSLGFLFSNVSANDSAFLPQCSESFKNFTFNSKLDFTVELNLNQIGPCEWHKKQPDFGNYDFFSSNMAVSKTKFSGSTPLNIKFNLSATENFKRGTFLVIRKIENKECKPEKGNFVRLGVWDGTLFLGTRKQQGKTKWEETKFSLDEKVSRNFEINIFPKSNDESDVQILVDKNKVFETTSYSKFCNPFEIQLGAYSAGNKNKPSDFVTLNFKDIAMNGLLIEENKDKSSQTKLEFAHLLSSYPLALCNDGSSASFYSSHELSEAFPKKVIIAFEGGGAALSLRSNETKYAEAYDKRPLRLMTSVVEKLNKKQKTLEGYFARAKQDGWGLIYLNYCSSDLYMGNHELNLDGKKFQVRGRKIVEALLDELVKYSVISSNTDLLLVGGSAGDLAISANLDLFEKLPHERLRLLFTIWQIPSETTYVNKKQKSNFNKIIPLNGLKFTHGNLQPHCRKSFSACGPNLENIQKYRFDDYFIEGHWKEMPGNIFAYTPRHMNNRELFISEIKQEIGKAGGGISFVGNKSWRPKKDTNHVMGNVQTSIGIPPVIPEEIVWNWISGSGETKYIGE